MTASFSFNLIDEPWLRCRWLDGRTAELGLRQTLLEAHRIGELTGDSPLVRVALHRLLLTVLHRVYGPAGYGAWAALWQAGQLDPAPLADYLARWHGRFDLFDANRPFYQAADPRVRPKSVINLIHELASGNNAVLFDHHTEDAGLALSPATAARIVVAAQAFGLGGLSGLEQKFTDGPCARGVLFLVEGDNLLETLLLNLLRYPDEEVLGTTAADRPAWEADDPFQPPRTRPLGYLDYLTWQNRRILLLPDDSPDGPVVRQMTVAPAMRLDAEVLDPFKHYRFDRKAPNPIRTLRFTEDRALWRDSAAVLALGQSETGDTWARPPLTFRWLHELLSERVAGLQRRQLLRYRAQGMSSDKAKVLFYRDEHMPLPLAYLEDDDLVDRLQEALDKAEAASRQLWGACRTLATYLVKPDADAEGAGRPATEDLDRYMNNWAPERAYWSALELPFEALVLALPGNPVTALAAWHETVQRTARRALEETIALTGDDGRALKAAVRAREQLAAGLANVYEFLKVAEV